MVGKGVSGGCGRGGAPQGAQTIQLFDSVCENIAVSVDWERANSNLVWSIFGGL